MKLIRVFPRKTNATPNDENVRFTTPMMFDKADEVHISVAFTWDLPKAEWLEKQWRHVAPTFIGGPATGMQGTEFSPGLYLKKGYTITSRGCPNRCWFCSVWKRDGNVRELEIQDGWNVLDDNLLACTSSHILSVFDMLKRQKERIQFTGGLEAARLRSWHVDLLLEVKPKQIFFAYDTEDDYEPLVKAGQMLLNAGFTAVSHTLRAYVLIGYPKDTIRNAEKRLIKTILAGFVPMAMLWRDDKEMTELEWRRFQRGWTRPAIIMSKYKGANQ